MSKLSRKMSLFVWQKMSLCVWGILTILALFVMGSECLPSEGSQDQEFPFEALIENEEWSSSFIAVMSVCLACVLVLSGLVIYKYLQPQDEKSAGDIKVEGLNKAATSAPAKSFFSFLFGKKESGVEATVQKTVNPVLQPVKFYSDFLLRREFKTDLHRKYHANVYYQSGTLTPMIDADRSNSSKIAYQSFTNGLADISQRYPVESVHTGAGVKGKTKEELAKIERQAKWERLIQDRYATDCTCRFKERLKYRSKAYYHLKKQFKAGKPIEMDPYIYGVPIRKDTQKLLCRAPEVKNSTISMLLTCFTILIYISVLWGNVSTLWNLSPSSTVLYNLLGLNITPNRLLITVFICKECMYITLPLILGVIGGFAVALSPLALVVYFFHHRRNKAIWTMFFPLYKDTIKPLIEDNIQLLVSLINSFSTVRAIRKLVENVMNSECNASLKDFDMVLLDFANLIFSITVILVGAEHNGELIPVSQMTSIPITLVKLLKAFVAQRLMLNRVYQSLKDVNENRLSKFELALLLTKYSEVLLSREVQYNFVQHFASGAEDPLDPDVAPMPFFEAKGTERLFRDMPALPESLALEFGHDMLGEYKDYKGKAVPYNSGLAGLAAATRAHH